MTSFPASATPPAVDLVESEMASELVPSPVPYAALVPRGAAPSDGGWPLLFFLHGGDGDRGLLSELREVFESAWAVGDLAPAVVVTPSCGRKLYLDLHDGSERWESFLVGPFLEHVRREHCATADRAKTAVCGISMGGLGALNLGFKHPQLFSAIGALEPGIMPALEFSSVTQRNQFFRGRRLLEQIHGRPIDPVHWAANNPASIVVERAEALREAQLNIYLECGDADSLRLHEGTEFLHRVLWDQAIAHEYHSVHGADHLGRTLRPRLREALAFVGRSWVPPAPDPVVEELRQSLDRLKRLQGVPDESAR